MTESLILDRYEIGSLIGRGGMAEVFQGRDQQTGIPVAIKRLRGDLITTQPESVERFRRESEVLGKLNHPNIVKLLTAGESGGQYYLIMEYVGGGTLADLLKRQPQLPLEQALGIALELADALARTHHLKIVHRDIKPTNILLAEDGTPRLTDFGLAFARSAARLTQPGIAVGTWLYLSPEVFSGSPPDERSDIWSFGLTLYEMLCGRLPFHGDTPTAILREITNSTIPRVTEFRHDVPAKLDHLIQRMLMRDTVLRAGSFRQIGAEIENILKQSHVNTPVSEPLSMPIEVQWTEKAEIPPSDSAPYLLTKISMPPLRQQHVIRERLIRSLDAGLMQGRGLTVVSAPPGFGKTTLVIAWLSAATRPVAWLSLDEHDNDLVHFLHYLIAALERVDARIGNTTHQLLSVPQLASLVPLLTPLINDLTGTPPLILVLDDYQAIHSDRVHEAMRFIVEHLPPSLHLVITSREEPALPLARLRVRNRITEIRERDLRFSADEAAAFLNETMRLNLAPAINEQLFQHTEGWIAALQLAALALQQEDAEAQPLIDEFTGDQRYLLDYLISEVLERQSEQARAFLRHTSILDQLCAPLCDAVLETSGSETILDQLERSNVFLLPLDQRRKWFRYHRLFADVIRLTLDPDEEVPLYQRAATWFAARSAGVEAVRYALAAAGRSHDYRQAVELITAFIQSYLNEGQLMTVLGWVNALPNNILSAHPELLIDRAWILVVLGELERADHALASAEINWERLNVAARGKLRLTQAFLALARGELALTVQFGQESNQLLSQTDCANWRVTALWVLAEAQERSAPITEAIASLREAAEVGGASGSSLFKSVIALSLATALNLNGQRREAISVCRAAGEHNLESDGQTYPAAPLLLSRMAELAYEANDLAQAQNYVQQAQALARQLGFDMVTAVNEAVAARLSIARGDFDDALLHLRTASAASHSSLADTTWIRALEGVVYLKRGDLLAARKWAFETGLQQDHPLHYLHMDQHIVYARLLLADTSLEELNRWLNNLDAFATERGYRRWLISIRLLRALAAARANHQHRANELLADAVRRAAPENYIRALLDEPDVLALLPAVRSEAPDFVDTVLRAAATYNHL